MLKAELKKISLNKIEENHRLTILAKWPIAKEALLVIQQAIKNPIAKMAIGLAITAGDAIYSKFNQEGGKNA